MKIFLFVSIIILSFSANANDLNVYGLGIYDTKFDGSDDKSTTDFRYERRFDKTIIDIGKVA